MIGGREGYALNDPENTHKLPTPSFPTVTAPSVTHHPHHHSLPSLLVLIYHCLYLPITPYYSTYIRLSLYVLMTAWLWPRWAIFTDLWPRRSPRCLGLSLLLSPRLCPYCLRLSLSPLPLGMSPYMP